jgi:hypothetical protein
MKAIEATKRFSVSAVGRVISGGYRQESHHRQISRRPAMSDRGIEDGDNEDREDNEK